MESPQYDGTYCATAFWTSKVGFQIEYWKQQNDLLNIPQGVARICYKDSIFENGWAQLEVETQRSYPDWVQAYAAGILEGSLTWNNIYNQWRNTIQSSCDRDEDSQNFCTWLRDLTSANFVKQKELASKLGENDHYWHQISLYFNQLEGIETGYANGAKRARSDLEEEIPLSDILLMNSAADIQDLKIYYENFVLPKQNATQSTETLEVTKNFFLPSATMLTKIFQTDDSPALKLLFGHSTAGSYASMLRIQKRYKFRYHFTPNQRTNTVPGVDITFTGYPGILGSTDDFYVVKGRQVQAIVAGVGIKNENIKLWQAVDITQSLPLAARVMAANRLAQHRRSWAKAMSKHPITGSKQWVTVDLNKLNPETDLYTKLSEDDKHDDAALTVNAVDEAAILERHNKNRGLIWIAEQLPGVMHMKDVTENFIYDNNTTWFANGVPYFEDILEASGVSPENFSFDVTPADNAELTNLEAVDKYLRKNGFRGDLLDEESVAYGNIDLKLFSYNARLGMSDYHAFAGPIFLRVQRTQSNDVADNTAVRVQEQSDVTSSLKDDRLSVSIEDASELAELEMITEKRSVRNDMQAIAMQRIGNGPFKWSDMSSKLSIEHEGHPNEWNFEKVSPKWAW
ncbi:putative phospholipase B-like lamina ancestor [Teleopsis dalmanni]|uniref:putative phospholipase B-like lamina ancestor n=1 Tax=Teleopsis dalmanni TaxID=139649 RepID=UPI0018CF130D|nr:putative phospholipase B-like lamina ancestor [Teleopsis dalmanni]